MKERLTSSCCNAEVELDTPHGVEIDETNYIGWVCKSCGHPCQVVRVKDKKIFNGGDIGKACPHLWKDDICILCGKGCEEVTWEEEQMDVI